jgi:SPP1 family predicted phage head-tail adaptor
VINAGDLDKRATLMKPLRNPVGDEILAWEPVASVWASVAPSVAPEITEGARTVAITRVAVVVRYRDDIDAGWRLHVAGRDFEIRGKADIALRHVRLELDCQEVI